MKDKTKRTWLIVLGSLACVALVIVIAGQFGSKRAADDGCGRFPRPDLLGHGQRKRAAHAASDQALDGNPRRDACRGGLGHVFLLRL